MKTNDIKIISFKLGINETIISLLFDRGFDTEKKINTFLYGGIEDLEHISLYKDIFKIRDKIFFHINKKSKIIIYGDYDCDGIMASAMLYIALKKLFANVEVFIPDRKNDGYGLTKAVLLKLIEDKSPDLIITVDCGITSIEEIDLLNKKNIDVIITDHHTPIDILPSCLIMNPHLIDGSTPLCGAGVVYKLIEALTNQEEANNYIDLCAIATIADIVPLIGDNRILAKEGLKILSNFSKRVGLNALFEALKIGYPKKIKSSDIAFKVAPTLNSAGRLSDALKSFELITTNDVKYAKILSKELLLENDERKKITLQTYEMAKKLMVDYNIADNKIIVLVGEWESGVVGIVASMLAEKFNRPTIILTKDDLMLKGSCRSIKGVNILNLLGKCSEYLCSYGGHAMAAGLSLKQESLNVFIKEINMLANNIYDVELFRTQYSYDIEFDFNDLNMKFASELSLLEPHGYKNSKPVFKTRQKEIFVQQINVSKHLKSEVNNELELIMFDKLDHYYMLKSNISKSLYYYVDINEFRNKKTVQCNILNIEYDLIKLDDSFLATEALQRYLNHKTSILSKKSRFYKPSEFFGRILLAFTNETFAQLSNQYPHYNKNLIKLNSHNAFNTILLAPSINETFEYYEEVVVYDSPPKEYIDTLTNKFGPIVKSGDINNIESFNVNYKDFNRDTLIKIYQFIRSYENKNIFSVYAIMNNIDKSIDYFTFLSALMVFLELGIVKLNNNVLHFFNKQTDLLKSKIYLLINNGFRDLEK